MSFVDIKTTINNSKLQINNQAVYQVLMQLVEALISFNVSDISVGNLGSNLLPNPIINDILIQASNPAVKLSFGESNRFGRIQEPTAGSIVLSQNLNHIGEGWYLDNINFPGWLVVLSDVADVFGVYRAAAGTNPAALQVMFQIGASEFNESGYWTPTDLSGAGLAFTFPINATYSRIGREVLIEFGIQFPVTASAAGVIIGGLPFPASLGTGNNDQFGGSIFYTTLGAMSTWVVGGSTIIPFDLTGAQLTNAICSGKDFRVFCKYLT